MTLQQNLIKIPTFIRQAFTDISMIICIKAGRRTGKTYNFAIWLIQQMDMDDVNTGLWVDTVHGNIDKYIERYFKPILKSMNYWDDCQWNAQKKILTLWNGKHIDFGSAERPENLEGFEYEACVINEAGIVLKKRGLWDNTLLPMLRKARVRLVGTPKGNNKYKELCAMYKTYTFTCYDSPFWTTEQIEIAKRSMTQEAFNQEMLALFIDGAGAVFHNINELATVIELENPKPDRTYYLSVDIAKHTDFTVICIGDVESKEIVKVDRFNQIDWQLQKSKIINLYNRYNCKKAIIDATGVGDAIFDDLVANGLNIEGFKFTASSKQELVGGLCIAMDNMDIRYHKHTALVDELSVFAYEQRSDGSFKYSAPDGLHDDCVMSLALMNRLFIQAKAIFTVADFG